VVILVHGIRDFAGWQSVIREALKKKGFTVELTNYMRLDLLRFLLPTGFFRRQIIDKYGTRSSTHASGTRMRCSQ